MRAKFQASSFIGVGEEEEETDRRKDRQQFLQRSIMELSRRKFL